MTELTQEDSVRLQKVLKTLKEMLETRGFLVDEEMEWPSASIVKTSADYERLDMILFHGTIVGERLLISFLNEKKPGKTALEEIGARMTKNKILHAILVTRDKLTPGAKQQLAELTRNRTETEKKAVRRKRIEVFLDEELLFNITTHELVPPHFLLNKEETEAVLKKYRATKNQLPMIQLNDPVVRFYGWRRGQFLRAAMKDHLQTNPDLSPIFCTFFEHLDPKDVVLVCKKWNKHHWHSRLDFLLEPTTNKNDIDAEEANVLYEWHREKFCKQWKAAIVFFVQVGAQWAFSSMMEKAEISGVVDKDQLDFLVTLYSCEHMLPSSYVRPKLTFDAYPQTARSMGTINFAHLVCQDVESLDWQNTSDKEIRNFMESAIWKTAQACPEEYLGDYWEKAAEAIR